MSLTNPNKVITEQRLSEFYGQILPYLGGMPEALANKFDKANLYSETEKIVGCWIDAKPLYQKTVKYTNLSFSSSWATLDNTTFASSMDMLVKSDIINIDTNGGIYAINDFQIRLNGGVLQKKYNSSVTAPTIYITYNYTKTTDQPNSFNIGSDTDYSTDEKIVGTWTDGRPVYQKTYVAGSKSYTANTVTNYVIDADFSGKELISESTVIEQPTARASMHGVNRVEGTGSYGYTIQVLDNKLQFTFSRQTGTSTFTINKHIITVQYTKTTD